MKKNFIIFINILFLFSNANAESFNAALKRAYDTNPELNAERENIVVSIEVMVDRPDNPP
mgnify:CR=1 FL=1